MYIPGPSISFASQSARGFVTGSGAGENFNKSSRVSEVRDYYPGGDHFLHSIISAKDLQPGTVFGKYLCLH